MSFKQFSCHSDMAGRFDMFFFLHFLLDVLCAVRDKTGSVWQVLYNTEGMIMARCCGVNSVSGP